MADIMPDVPSQTASRIDAIRRDLDSLVRFAERIELSVRDESREPGGTEEAPPDGEAIWKHNLNALCDSLRREYGIPTRVTDLPGKGLRRAKLYITRHAGLPFPADTEAWRCLLKYSDIRNLVAHRDSLLKDDDPELIRFIEGNPRLSIDASQRVRLHEGALAEVIDYLHRFFRDLADCLRSPRP
jgi:hypothetical protein